MLRRETFNLHSYKKLIYLPIKRMSQKEELSDEDKLKLEFIRNCFLLKNASMSRVNPDYVDTVRKLDEVIDTLDIQKLQEFYEFIGKKYGSIKRTKKNSSS